MTSYAIVATPAATKEFDRLPEQIRRRFKKVFPTLEEDPWTPRPGCHIEPLEGMPGARKLRIGHYRGIYEIDGSEILFTKFGHRPTVYR